MDVVEQFKMELVILLDTCTLEEQCALLEVIMSGQVNQWIDEYMRNVTVGIEVDND